MLYTTNNKPGEWDKRKKQCRNTNAKRCEKSRKPLEYI
jgi:hypothetical protein